MELPEELISIAQTALHETPERRAAALVQLKRMCAGHQGSSSAETAASLKHLIAAVAETGVQQEELFLQHLRARKFDVSKAHKSLCLRAAFLRDHPDLATNITGTDFLDMYGSGMLRVLPGTDRCGRRVISLRPANLPEVKVDPLLIRWQVWCMSRLARDPKFQVNGVVLIMNFDSLKLSDAKYMAGQLTRGRMRLGFHYVKDCAPTRIGGIYFMNQPAFISIVWSLVSLFMGKKIRSRVRFLGGNLAALHEHIGPEQLPALLGGTLQQENPLEWLQEQIELQALEADAVRAAKARHDAAANAVSSWVLDGDEEDSTGEDEALHAGSCKQHQVTGQ